MLASTKYPSHPDWHESSRNNYTHTHHLSWTDLPSRMISVHVQKIIAVFRKSYPLNTTTTTTTTTPAVVGADKNKVTNKNTNTTTAAAAMTVGVGVVAATATPLYVWDKGSTDENNPSTQTHDHLCLVNNNNNNNSSNNNVSNSNNNSSSSSSTLSSSSLHKPTVLPTSTTSSSWWQRVTSPTSSKPSPSPPHDNHTHVNTNYWEINDNQCKLLFQEKIMKMSYATLYCEIMRDFQSSPSSSSPTSATTSTSSIHPSITTTTTATTSSPSTDGGVRQRKLRLLLVGSSTGSNITLITNLWSTFFAGMVYYCN